jgi:hypothetical protein
MERCPPVTTLLLLLNLECEITELGPSDKTRHTIEGPRNEGREYDAGHREDEKGIQPLDR